MPSARERAARARHPPTREGAHLSEWHRKRKNLRLTSPPLLLLWKELLCQDSKWTRTDALGGEVPNCKSFWIGEGLSWYEREHLPKFICLHTINWITSNDQPLRSGSVKCTSYHHHLIHYRRVTHWIVILSACSKQSSECNWSFQSDLRKYALSILT